MHDSGNNVSYVKISWFVVSELAVGPATKEIGGLFQYFIRVYKGALYNPQKTTFIRKRLILHA